MDPQEPTAHQNEVLGAMDDESAADFYSDPANRVADGKGRRRKPSSARLTQHVPIRFSREVIDKVQRLAELEHKTISSWIRDTIEDEVQRRLPAVTATRSGAPLPRFQVNIEQHHTRGRSGELADSA